jgi:PPOX class probable F420-dependent enzyme
MAAAEIPATHKDLLEGKGFLHLASLGPDGAPQVHPVWYEWDGGELLVSSTKPRQKTKNLERDGRVAGSILDPENAYRYLEVRGTVTSIEDDPKSALIDRLAQKYLGEDKYPWDGPDPQRVIIRIRPERFNTMG